MNSTEKETFGIIAVVIGVLVLVFLAFAVVDLTLSGQEDSQRSATQAAPPTPVTVPPSTTTTTLSPEDQAKLDRERLNAEIRKEIDATNRKLGVGDYATASTTATTMPPRPATRTYTPAESCALLWPDDGTFASADGWAVCMYGDDTNAYNAWFNAYWDMYERSNP